MVKQLFSQLYHPASQESDHLIFAAGIILAGMGLLIISDLLFHGPSVLPLYYGMFAWASVRLISFFGSINTNFLSKTETFSIVFSIYCLSIALSGYFHINFPLHLIAPIAVLDILIFITQYLKLGRLYLLAFCFGFFFLSNIAFQGVQTPWFSTFSPLGIGYIDTFRDAAAINAWAHYDAITHGIHGLLMTPYHSLMVQFNTPFLSNTGGNVFKHLQYYTFAGLPAVLIYGISKLIELIADTSVVRHKWFYLIGFVLTFSALFLMLVQRSSTVATLLSIACLPLLLNVWKTRDASSVSLFVLACLMPLMLYARVFHGLVLMGVMLPLIFDRKPYWKGIFPLMGAVANIMMLGLFYTSVKRNSGVHFHFITDLWFSKFFSTNFLNIHGFLLVLVSVILFKIWRIQSLDWRARFSDPVSRLVILAVTAVLSVMCIALKCNSSTDLFYSSILMSWIIFFVLISRTVFIHFSPLISQYFSLLKVHLGAFLGLNIRIFTQNAQGQLIRRKHAVLYSIMFLFLLGSNFNIHQFQLGLNFFKLDPKIIGLKDPHALKCDHRRFDLMCRWRIKKFQVAQFDLSKPSNLLMRIGEIAQRESAKNLGNTAIYLPPKHIYWQMFGMNQVWPPIPLIFGDIRITTLDMRYSALYFMSEYGIPLIYGLHPALAGGYTFDEVRDHQGTLRSLSAMKGFKGLCTVARSVNIDHVLFFKDNLSYQLLHCLKRPTHSV